MREFERDGDSELDIVVLLVSVSVGTVRSDTVKGALVVTVEVSLITLVGLEWLPELLS